jgi:hypothetical protein
MRTTFEPYAAWRRACHFEQQLSGPLQCPHLRSDFIRKDPPAGSLPAARTSRHALAVGDVCRMTLGRVFETPTVVEIVRLMPDEGRGPHYLVRYRESGRERTCGEDALHRLPADTPELGVLHV